MVIGKYIRQLLEERNRVILPGFGNLEVKDTSELPSSGGRLDPPGPAVKFDASFSKDDGLLASTITSGEGVDAEKASQWVLELVDAIRFALDKGEPCQIPETGTFTRDENGKIHFRADPGWILEPEQYGLEPMDLLELEDQIPVEEVAEPSGEQQETSDDRSGEQILTGSAYSDLQFTDEAQEEGEGTSAEQEKEEIKAEEKREEKVEKKAAERKEEKKEVQKKEKVTPLYRDAVPQEKKGKRSRSWKVIWIIAAVLVVALLILIFVPTDRIERLRSGEQAETPVSEPQTTPSDEITGPAEEVEQPVTADETTQEVVEEPAVESVQPGGKTYYIIAGSFSHLSYASDLQDNLKQKGYPAEVMVTDNRMYRVSVASLASMEEAERELARIKRVRGMESCWLLAN